ncbi:MAG: Zn-dependent protease [Francisellaceae bacterium]|nr:Zn-dependent protease [Francisellaceae bacterium]
MLKSELNEIQLKEKINFILDKAKLKGATSAEADISASHGIQTSVRLNEIENLEFTRDKSVSITLYKNHKKGSASTSDISDKALLACVEQASLIADYTEEDNYSGLAPKPLMAKMIPDLNLYHPLDISAADAIETAKICEAAGLSFDKRISNSEGASLGTHSGLYVYGNSHGFLESYKATRFSLSCALIADSKGHMQRDYDYSVARDYHDLKMAAEIGVKAAERTLKKLCAQKINTCHAPVIFESRVATGLFKSFISAISGGNLYRKSSFLLDGLETQIFPQFISLRESPHLPKALGSAPFDSEGVGTYEHDIICEGFLKSYVLSAYSARKLGLQTTGNAGGIHNLKVLTNTDIPFFDLVKKMDRGLLVTDLMGQGINIVTGDYSRGASGFWVENGEIQYPVEEITIAGNLRDMFRNIIAIANDTFSSSNYLTGSVLIHNMTIAGN